MNTDKPDRRKRDLNNLNKAIFKALVHRDVLFDDEQIIDIIPMNAKKL
ncbi:RusA family crossover junction endodeoxyribonuclease [Frischella perrara]